MSKSSFQRSQFTFYESYFTAVDQLPKTRKYEALSAIVCFALYGVEPEGLSPQASAVFTALRPNLASGRAKAQARKRELSDGEEIIDSDSPTGMNKKENKKENKYKNKIENKNENENKNEYKNEHKDENEFECEEAAERAAESKSAGKTPPMGAGECFAAGAASPPSSDKNSEMRRLYAENPALREPMEQLLARFERENAPLTLLEQKLNALALAVQEPDRQLDSVRWMLRTGARLVPEKKHRLSS